MPLMMFVLKVTMHLDCTDLGKLFDNIMCTEKVCVELFFLVQVFHEFYIDDNVFIMQFHCQMQILDIFCFVMANTCKKHM